MSAMWACLVLSVLLGWGCIAGGKAQQLGTPLSDQEYRQFFMSLRAAGRARTACLLRMLYGCQNPLVQRLDKYENHGAIPEGPICSELPGNPFFPNFCTFSLYRCTRKWYFIKRTACPGELGRTQASNDMAMSSDAMSSTIFRPQLLFPMSPATAQPAHSITDTKIVVIPASSPESKNIQPNPSDPHATEVTARGQQQGRLPTSDIQDLLLRLQDTYVQSSAQTLQWLLTMGNAARETDVRAAALRLLADLNNARVSERPASTDTWHRRKK
ncbi:acrosin-binding protein [Columba livia]|uniref:acrosin-binding protein n=1 Tax=Columba livia TaxID=8932 RepID=UPI0031BB1D48